MVELVPLPRQQVGPFLILGVDKDASQEAVEAAWAQRLIWARRNLVKTPLEDINWAREMLSDSQRRLQADASSLNVDTTDGTLRHIRHNQQGKTGCQPIDVEKDLKDYVPTAVVPASEEVSKAISLPELPREIPAVALVLDQFIQEPLDPWEIFKGNDGGEPSHE
jgi:hypothetical protein